MPEPLEEQLVLDITPALASLADLDTAFQAVVTNFSSSLTDAFTGFATSLDTPQTVPISADTTEAESQVATLDAAQTVPIDADTNAAEAQITGLDTTQVTVPTDADTSQAQTEISALDTAPVTVSVDADTSQAQDAIDGLGTSASNAIGSGSSGGGSGLGGLEGAVLGVEAATGAATGEVSGLTSGLGALGGAGTAAAIGGGAAFTGFLGETVKLAADAQAQNRLFASTFGDVANQARQINIGGLNISLEELGKQSGTAVANLEASATRIGLLGNASGAAAPQIATTASSVLGIAGALSVANPRFGDAATVADTLSRALATGRTRSLIPYGISISSAAIQQEALNENVGKTAQTLTGYDKLLAGVTLVSQQFGDTLGTKFADGTQNAQVQLRALKTQIEETLVAVGTPLLGPAIQSLQDFIPVAQAVGVALGQLAQAVLPIVASLAPALIPVAQVIGLVGDGITALSDSLHALSSTQLLGIAAGFGAIAISSGAASTAVFELGLAFDTALGPIGIAVGALAVLGAAFGVFDHEAPAASADAEAFAKALLDSGTAAHDLAGAVAPLGPALGSQLDKLLQTGKAGQTAADGAAALGLSYDSLTNTLLSTDDAFDSFITKQIESLHGSGDQLEAQNNLIKTLQQTREGLVAGAQAALQSAVAQGTLTQAQIDATVVQTGISTAGGGAIAIYEKLKPVIDAAAASQEAQTVATADQSGAFAQLRAELASGAIDATTATDALTKLGLSSQDAKTFIDGVNKAVQNFIDTAVKALPSASGEVDNFQKGITDAFDKVQKDVHDKTGNVKADLLTLKAALDPASFIKSLFADAATIAQFTENLRKLGEEGFTALEAEIALKGPVAGGNLAASLASDENKAKFATAGLAAGQASTDALIAELKGRVPGVLTASSAQGDALGTGINTGYSAKLDLANITAHQVAEAGKAVTVATPTVEALAGAAGGLIMERFRGQLDLPGAATSQTAAAGTAIAGGSDRLAPVAGKTAKDTTSAFGSALGLPGKVSDNLLAASKQLGLSNIIPQAESIGESTGQAFDFGFSQGLRNPGAIAGIHDAAAAAALAAKTAAEAALKIKSPSLVGQDIGQQFVAGIALGLDQVGAVEKSSAALGAAIAGGVNPSIPNIPTPNLTIAGPRAATASTAAAGNLTLDLTVQLQDGREVKVAPVTIPIPRTSDLNRRVAASVAAL